jgi:hypothetical protein
MLLSFDFRWFEFDDTRVSNFNTKNLKTETFGGDIDGGYFDWATEKSIEKSRNAYLLVYQRVVPRYHQEHELIKYVQFYQFLNIFLGNS